jgi:hypothetical protein
MVQAARKEHTMRRIVIALSLLIVFGGIAGGGRGVLGEGAEYAAPATLATHPFVGTWVVDTVVASDTDSPEIAIATADGRLAGLGANRVAGGTWEAVDDRTAMLTLVSVFDQGGVGRYVVVRGPHVVDATGDAWTCQCTVTVVGADGTVLDSMVVPASARRLPLQGPEAMGTPVAVVPTWTPPMLEAATPAT